MVGKWTELYFFLPRDSVSLRRVGQYQYPALDTKYEDSQYLVDDSKYAPDTEDSKSFDHLMPSSGYVPISYPALIVTEILQQPYVQ